MRIECSNCRRISTVSSDLILTHKRALELSCSQCKADIHVQLCLPAEKKQISDQMTASHDHATRLTSTNAETPENPEHPVPRCARAPRPGRGRRAPESVSGCPVR